jgi:hypothetical protein
VDREGIHLTKEKCSICIIAILHFVFDGFGALAEPVLLIYGDIGLFCIDCAFGGGWAPKFYRFSSARDWVIDAMVVEVYAAAVKIPFGFRCLLLDHFCGEWHSRRYW